MFHVINVSVPLYMPSSFVALNRPTANISELAAVPILVTLKFVMFIDSPIAVNE